MNKFFRKALSLFLSISLLLVATIVTPTATVATTDAFLVTPSGLDFGPVQVGVTSATQTVTVTNVGTSSVTISIAGGAPGSPFSAGQDFHLTSLAPGAQGHIIYSFTPTAAGLATATSSFSLNDQPFTVNLAGTGVAPQFLVTPSGLDFGPVQVGVTSATQTVTVTNVGTSSVTISIAGGAPGSPFSAGQDFHLTSLAPGAQGHIIYSFTPTAAGLATATSFFSLNDQPFTVNLAGTGVASPVTDAFLVTPSGLDFGPVQVGVTSATQTVTVTNVGTSSVTISIAGGAPGSPFSAGQDFHLTSLAPGAQGHIIYSFTPTAAGLATATSSFSLNDQPFTVNLAGTGVAPQFLVTPSGLDFGPVQVGVTSATQTVTVTNVGTSSVTISIAGGAPGSPFSAGQDFHLTSLAPGAQGHIIYSFTPTAAGLATATSSFSLNDQPFTVNLAGTGVGPMALSIEASPTTYDAVGQTINYSYVIKNTGTVTLDGPFSISDNKLGTINCPTGSLEPNATVTCAASYAIQQSNLDAGSLQNTATASTIYNSDTITSNQAQATVVAVQNPAITLTKSANPITYSKAGDIIGYTLIAKNTGNVTLHDVSISDPKLGALTCTPAQPATLAPNASLTCAGSYTIQAGDIAVEGKVTNTGTTSGKGPQDQPVSATASATVKLSNQTGALTQGYWQNKNGQRIIKEAGSVSGVCTLTPWLRQYASFQDLSASASCDSVAAYVANVVKAANAKGNSMNAMLKSQMLATALDVYFSDPALGGNKIKAPEPIGGVTIDLTAVPRDFKVPYVYQDYSSAFGGAASMKISDILTYAASRSNAGGSMWYANIKSTQEMAKNTFDAINNQQAWPGN